MSILDEMFPPDGLFSHEQKSQIRTERLSKYFYLKLRSSLFSSRENLLARRRRKEKNLMRFHRKVLSSVSLSITSIYTSILND